MAVNEDKIRELSDKHCPKFEKMLLGKSIKAIQVFTSEQTGFYCNVIGIILDDGTILIPQMDNEGNDGGATLLITPEQNEHIIYTL